MDAFSLYCHIPFCKQRCHYCDFVTTAGQLNHLEDYIDAMSREISMLAQVWGNKLPIHTLFFGGGTPSLVSIELYSKLFDTFERVCNFTSNIEISLEANPGTVNQTYLKLLRQIGFNRISLGAQSVHAEELKLLGRIHNAAQIKQAVEWSSLAGFENLNLDLMFGLPRQTLSTWQETLDTILDLKPEHISMYALTLEEGTPLAKRVTEGEIPQPDEDLAASMYELAMAELFEKGFEQYEISNWATVREGRLMACRHNLQYWRNGPYLGLGAGAHGFAAGSRLENTPNLETYIMKMNNETRLDFPRSQATINLIPINTWDEIQETMMLGLRLTGEGVGEIAFQTRFGRSLEAVFPQEIKRLLARGLLEWGQNDQGRCLRLTQSGRILGNQAFMAFVGLEER